MNNNPNNNNLDDTFKALYFGSIVFSIFLFIVSLIYLNRDDESAILSGMLWLALAQASLWGFKKLFLSEMKDIDTNGINKVVLAISVAMAVIFVSVLISKETKQSETDKLYEKYTSSTYSSTTSSSTYSSPTPPYTDAEIEQKKKEFSAIYANDDNKLIITEGYTYDKCVQSAKQYIKTKYSKTLFEKSAVVIMDIQYFDYYFVSGITYDKKTVACTIHHHDQIYEVIDDRIVE